MKVFIQGNWRETEARKIGADLTRAILKTWAPVIGYVLAGLAGVLIMGVIKGGR